MQMMLALPWKSGQKLGHESSRQQRVQFVDGLKMEEKDWVGRRGPLEAQMASQGGSMGKSQPAEM